MDTDDDWRFYKAKNFERPSAQELKDVKGIIISYSCYKIKNKVAKDESKGHYLLLPKSLGDLSHCFLILPLLLAILKNYLNELLRFLPLRGQLEFARQCLIICFEPNSF